MKNIWKVFLADAKRISSNVVALVIIMGLSIIPALYAWFNIMSNWDPYGKDATSQMKISVYSEDRGFTYEDLHVCIGDTIVDNLKANDTIAWQFSESRDEALTGVNSGECYAALIIPENFTSDMLSFFGGEIKNPCIQYYENSKKNAIATKITAKVKTTVQQSVNTSVMNSLAVIISKSGEAITGETNGTNMISTITDKLEDMNKSLGTYASILTTLALLTESSDNIVASMQDVLPTVEDVIDAGTDSLSGMQTTVITAGQTAESFRVLILYSFDAIDDGLNSMQKQIDALDVALNFADVSVKADLTMQLLDSMITVLEHYRKNDGGEFDQALDEVIACNNQLKTDVNTFTTDVNKTQEKVKKLQETATKEIKASQAAMRKLQDTFNYDIVPELNQAVNNINQSLVEAQLILNNIDDNFPMISLALDDYSKVLSSGTEGIRETRDDVLSIQTGLREIIDGLNTLSTDEQYVEISKLLETDPTLIASFVTDPISMETIAIYEITSYGSAMAPFYTVLALWVGGLIMVALLHVKVKNTPEIEGVKSWQKFFGRYLLFFFVGQAQTLVTVLGNLFFIEIQCIHPFLFWLAAAVISFMFTFFMYALTVAWGNVGQAIAVIVMVIQVAGAGGTFPIEVLPVAYRMIYQFLPFTYAMNALRECVAGMYRFDYAIDLGVLFIYIIVSVFIGLFFGIPFRKLIKKLEESKEKSGIML